MQDIYIYKYYFTDSDENMEYYTHVLATNIDEAKRKIETVTGVKNAVLQGVDLYIEKDPDTKETLKELLTKDGDNGVYNEDGDIDTNY